MGSRKLTVPPLSISRCTPPKVVMGLCRSCSLFGDRGDDDYALRPELTPTVARLAADAVRQRPLPLRWFGIGPFFRGERPQRGRLREFLQWNADVIGDPSMNAELDLLGLLAGTLERFGLRPSDVTIRLSHRDAAASVLQGLGVNEDQLHAAFTLLDRKEKMPRSLRGQSPAIGAWTG